MKEIQTILLAALAIALCQPVMAADQPKIAVVDVRTGVMKSDDAKLKMEKLKGEFEQEKADLEGLRMDLQKLEEKAKKDGAVMSADEKRKLEKEMMEKANEFKFKGQQFQQSSQAEAQEVFQALIPKFQKALQAIVDEQGFDLVLHREAALMVKPEYEITDTVTAKMNSLKD